MAYILDEPSTPVIISDTGLSKITSRDVSNIGIVQNEILSRIQGWKRSWEEKDINNYLDYYTDSAKYNNDNYLKWTTHKKNVFEKSKDLIIKIENISLFEYPGDHQELILVQFKQKYSSNLLNNEMIKQQIWVKRDSRWSIIYEGGT